MATPHLTLYHGLASTCSKKVRLTLYEKRLPFESRLLNLQKFEQHDPEYLKINPNGVVPALVDDGTPVIDSSIIIEYLEDKYPDVPLAPTEAKARADMRKWLKFSDNVAYDAVYLPTWALLSAPVARALSDADREAMLSRVPTKERRDRWETVAGTGFTPAQLAEARDKMVNCLLQLDEGLEERDWLLGDMFSLADIATVPFIDRIKNLYPELLTRDYANVMRWLSAFEKRPAFDKAFKFKDDPKAAELPSI